MQAETILERVCVPAPLFMSLFFRNIERGLILDPSCFYSKWHLGVVQAILDCFKPAATYLPERMARILEDKKQDEFRDFLRDHWLGEDYYSKDAWHWAVGLSDKGIISAWPRGEVKGAFEERLWSELDREFPDEKDVIYDVLAAAERDQLPILAFRYASWQIVDKAERVGLMVVQLPDTVHKYKVRKIAPFITRLALPVGLMGAALIAYSRLEGFGFATGVLVLME